MGVKEVGSLFVGGSIGQVKVQMSVRYQSGTGLLGRRGWGQNSGYKVFKAHSRAFILDKVIKDDANSARKNRTYQMF